MRARERVNMCDSPWPCMNVGDLGMGVLSRNHCSLLPDACRWEGVSEVNECSQRIPC